MDDLKSAFINSTFEFKENNRFNLNIDFMKELDEMMKNVHWKWNSDKTEIIIQKWKNKDTDKYQLMGIQISEKDRKMYFVMTELPFVLEMKKKLASNKIDLVILNKAGIHLDSKK
ncbi:hypothetical protein ES692_16550 [Psychroserpens burtonensis]|uniref:Uncharacterized protein n=1 Tax=Psychroserpens burtonensis TaxID=49278 RepID=A0A5C7B6M2_9FLAO|nr:hypothetical protein [Psychroserpens burtonensis]TXE15470.1 hypothetical protein ES692_16550 [Psychroserpens burtonensis]